MELRLRRRRKDPRANDPGRERGKGNDSVYEDPPDRPAGGEDPAGSGNDVAASQGPKVTPIFVPDPPPPSKRATVAVDVLGRVRATIAAESPTAAGHWDIRFWRRLR